MSPRTNWRKRRAEMNIEASLLGSAVSDPAAGGG